MTRKPLSFLTLLVLIFPLPGLAAAETNTFADPLMGRYRLDYCRYVQADCGIAAARAWCIRQGYQEAESYRGERSVGPTTRVGDRSTCRGSDCDGFSEITCSRDGPPRAVIVEPRDTPSRDDAETSTD